MTRRVAVVVAAVVAAIAAVVVVHLVPRAAATPVPGGSGTDTSLPATDSKVTVSGRGPFSSLKVTVNQTEDLVNQAVSVTWTGGTPTESSGVRFHSHYLQIFQCWGDDDGTVPGNPGPPPEQCQQGASDGVVGGRSAGLFPGGGATLERIISREGAENFDPSAGVHDERTGYVWRPFRPVDGDPIGIEWDPTFNPSIVGGNYWLNPYFNVITTNEIPGGRTSQDGTGAELFEAQTGLEASGLGCGQKVQAVEGGEPKIPRCWLVVVPRGDAATENAGTGFSATAGVFTSPLAPAQWANRISIPLEFNPLESSCDLSDDQRRIVGSELLVSAISSWQHALCANADLSPYAYGSVSDALGRVQVTTASAGAAGMAVVSRPISPDLVDPLNPVIYAPLTLSGVVVGFNIERVPNPTIDNPEEAALRGVRVAHLNLTPRLVAKLLTQSYRTQVEILASDPGYGWRESNSRHLAVDPDFLRFNPEFELLQTVGGKNMGGLSLAAPSSDVATQVWQWVLSDPEARAWVSGTPDEWGMKVNPVYSGTLNADALPDTYPKSDPYCFQGPAVGSRGDVVPPLLCGLDWVPYTQTMRDAARLTRLADDGARTATDPFAESPSQVYKRDGPQSLGSRAFLSITDSASAAQYGLQTANLSRAGDDRADRTFIAAKPDSFLAGVEEMVPGAVDYMLEPNPAPGSAAAYPLTSLTYAAIAPLAQDERARTEYAAFVEYAAGAGQVVGRELGQLPPGYAPLPQEERDVALATADLIRTMTLAAPEEPAVIPESIPIAGAVDPIAVVAAALATLNPPASSGSLQIPGQTQAARLAPVATSEESVGNTGRRIIDRLATSRLALPGLFVFAIAAAIAALEITKRPRWISRSDSDRKSAS